MSIQILPQEALQQAEQKPDGIVAKIPLLFLPNAKSCFAKRAERLAKLASDHPLADYLAFCQQLATVQHQLVKSQPLQHDVSHLVAQAAAHNTAPLAADNFTLADNWVELCRELLAQFTSNTPAIMQSIAELKQMTDQMLLTQAQHLRAGEFAQVSTQHAPFLWAALAVYYVQLAQQLPGKAVAKLDSKPQLCPVCHSHPVASVVHLGSNAGLRYLHCSLCESEWYAMRAKCSNCQADTQLDYFAFEADRAAIKTECCDQCHGYLKLLNQELDPYLEVVADDIASLMLDIKTEEEGFSKTGLNPFLFSEQ